MVKVLGIGLSSAFVTVTAGTHPVAASRVSMLSDFQIDFGSSIVTSAVTSATSYTNAWSVGGDKLGSADLASSLFASSLAPYLVLLFFLSRKPTKTPPLANFGFQFLLAFVFATIPAGIYAKIHYHEILANVDWLHGGAESLLSVTNLFILFGFRSVRPLAEGVNNESITTDKFNYTNFAIPALVAITMMFDPGQAEPVNALSLTTWVVHSSSILEWLAAMSMIWGHAQVSGNPRWKGMTWAMVPSHASGLCACTYHVFYNSPFLTSIVTAQAGLTVIGNSCMALAAYRIFAYEAEAEAKAKAETERTGKKESGMDALVKMLKNDYEGVGLEGVDWLAGISSPPSSMAKNRVPLKEGAADVTLELLTTALLIALLVKYGELYFKFPFSSSPEGSAFNMIFYPTVLVAVQYQYFKKSPRIENGIVTDVFTVGET